MQSRDARSSAKRRALLSVLAFAVSLGSALGAMASGYAIKEQSASLLGTAFAGAGASAQDPSVMFFNPAGIARLDGYRFSGSGSGIFARTEFSNDGSALAPLGLPIPGGNGGDAGEDALVPAFYVSAAPADFPLHFGLGVNAPFGLTNEYSEDWVGRYHAIESTLESININPVVAVKPLSWLSLGAGMQIQHIDAKLTRAIDFGSILAGLGAPGAVPFGSDGEVKLRANDWGFGFTAGVLVEPIPGTRAGLSYRSYIDQHLSGDASFKNVPSLLQAVPTFQSQNASTQVSTPDSVDLSIYQEITDRWAVLGDVQWTNWSRFDELRVDFEGAGVPDDVTQERWDDSWFFALGTQYMPLDRVTLRAGVAYDQTPVRDEFRTARLPDQDRYWIAAGIGYAFSDWISADLGYTHIFVRDADIDENVAAGPLTYQLHGQYDNAIDIVSLQGNLRF